MATKADFTEEEWKAMQLGVTGAGMLVSVDDPDFSDSFGEASALAKHVGAQRQTSSSELIRELCHMRGSGFGMSASQHEVESRTLAALGLAVAAIGAKAPEDLEAYRELVRGTAVAVAEAKGGISARETAAIDQINAALGGV